MPTAKVLVLPVAAVLSVAMSPASSAAQAVTPTIAAPQSLSPLDGTTFDAAIVRTSEGADGAAEPLKDSLRFSGGMFSSKICERYGFVPAAYWVRGTADAIEFHAVLQSPTDGTMRWTGVVREGKLEGTMRWTRTRWYWTIDAEHRIAGQIAAASPAPAISQ